MVQKDLADSGTKGCLIVANFVPEGYKFIRQSIGGAFYGEKARVTVKDCYEGSSSGQFLVYPTIFGWTTTAVYSMMSPGWHSLW
jgi:hypothetical protein